MVLENISYLNCHFFGFGTAGAYIEYLSFITIRNRDE